MTSMTFSDLYNDFKNKFYSNAKEGLCVIGFILIILLSIFLGTTMIVICCFLNTKKMHRSAIWIIVISYLLMLLIVIIMAYRDSKRKGDTTGKKPDNWLERCKWVKYRCIKQGVYNAEYLDYYKDTCYKRIAEINKPINFLKYLFTTIPLVVISVILSYIANTGSKGHDFIGVISNGDSKKYTIKLKVVDSEYSGDVIEIVFIIGVVITFVILIIYVCLMYYRNFINTEKKAVSYLAEVVAFLKADASFDEKRKLSDSYQ